MHVKKIPKKRERPKGKNNSQSGHRAERASQRLEHSGKSRNACSVRKDTQKWVAFIRGTSQS